MNKKNILVTGSDGQLGRELQDLSKAFSGLNFHFTTRQQLSIEDTTAIEDFISSNKIDYCINCAAYTAVDKAEQEPEIANLINGEAVGAMADITYRLNCGFIHISTDYVFNGDASVPYNESQQTDPVNLYGRSKLEGELAAMQKNPGSIIIRTSWLYSSYGKNFIKTMIRLMNEKESIGVVSDQYGSPTYAADLAAAIISIIQHPDAKAGIYHYSNKGIISWYDLAVEINVQINSNCKVNPIKTTDYPTPAKRPAYSAFDTSKIQQQFNIQIPHWKDSLAVCLGKL